MEQAEMNPITHHSSLISIKDPVRAELASDTDAWLKRGHVVTTRPGYVAMPVPPRPLNQQQRIQVAVDESRQRKTDNRGYTDVELRQVVADAFELLRTRRMTMQCLSRAAGLAKSALSKYANKETLPSSESYQKLRKYIDAARRG